MATIRQIMAKKEDQDIHEALREVYALSTRQIKKGVKKYGPTVARYGLPAAGAALVGGYVGRRTAQRSGTNRLIDTALNTFSPDNIQKYGPTIARYGLPAAGAALIGGFVGRKRAQQNRRSNMINTALKTFAPAAAGLVGALGYKAYRGRTRPIVPRPESEKFGNVRRQTARTGYV